MATRLHWPPVQGRPAHCTVALGCGCCRSNCCGVPHSASCAWHDNAPLAIHLHPNGVAKHNWCSYAGACSPTVCPAACCCCCCCYCYCCAGTGKTTFIKALATHTKRSIINIPLGRIKTNQQLMDMMMDQRVKVRGTCKQLMLAFYIMARNFQVSQVVEQHQQWSTCPVLQETKLA